MSSQLAYSLIFMMFLLAGGAVVSPTTGEIAASPVGLLARKEKWLVTTMATSRALGIAPINDDPQGKIFDMRIGIERAMSDCL